MYEEEHGNISFRQSLIGVDTVSSIHIVYSTSAERLSCWAFVCQNQSCLHGAYPLMRYVID